MSKIVAVSVIRGAKKIVKEAGEFLNKSILEKGQAQKIGFPETAFYLPMAYALMGIEAKTLKDANVILEHAKSLLPAEPAANLWLPYLGGALDAGIAALLAEEIIMVLRYLYNQEPQKDCNGFFTDTIMRSLGIQLVDGRMPGFAAILGAAPDNQTAVEIIRGLQQRNILIFVGSNTAGRSIIDQLIEEDVQMGWDNYIVPYGRDTISAIYPLNWAIRSALTFGGLKAGQGKKCLLYTKERVFAFGLALGEVDDLKYATGAGAINMGFPIIADTLIPEIKPSGITTYEALVKELDHKKIVARAIEARGVKVTVTQIPIPVPYAAAFEGERVRREQLYVEFGGKSSLAFEYLASKKSEEVEDGRVEVIGPDIDQLEKGNKSMPLAIIVEVAGRKMQKEFEPILERQVHRYINYTMGVMHVGQRDMNWIRINQQDYSKGFRLKHFGVILHAIIHKEYGAIVDKVQVKLYTQVADVQRLLAEAKKAYDERDERLSGMTDESVDTFYSCLLCQSFAPNHICVVTPERLGLCGAYSWLDAKACFEITPSGPNQPVTKGKVLNEKFGQWENVNNFVYEKSNK
ncbi:MAG: CO dehydrogenase/CO-methylating acetyl-CoA synthase complex subunit beta, partial [Candidatus Omnitrophota bacterium]